MRRRAACRTGIVTWIAHTIRFWLTDLRYRFPLIGKLSLFSRDYAEASRGGWLNSEASLCQDYARHVSAISSAEFRKNSEYLRKSYDHGRQPQPLWAIVVLTVLVLLEGLGFSYLLSSWMALEGSENDKKLLTGAIVIVLAAILVWVTHSAGHQLYRTKLLRSCFRNFQAHGLHDPNKQRSLRQFTTETISLSDDQSIDDKQPQHVQCANRVATTPDDIGNYAWVWLAAALIGCIAVLSTVLRIESMRMAASQGASPVSLFRKVAAVSTETQDAQQYAALSSFWILATIFVVTQLVSMGVGFRYGFAGKQSREAYQAIQGCADYETYFKPIRRRMSIADLRLTTLHRLMEKRLAKEIDWSRDFLTYIRAQRERGATDLQDPTDLYPNAAPPRIEDKSAGRRSEAAPADGTAVDPEVPDDPTADTVAPEEASV